MLTIHGAVTNGITLGQAGYTSPLIITGSGTVSSSTGAAVYASGSYADPLVINHGAIIDTGGFDAVELNDGGSVANTGLMQGYNGIAISGAAGAVTNSGTIAGTGAYGAGVVLDAGGSVHNTGLIEGRGVAGYFYYGGNTYKYLTGGAVTIAGSAGAVTNSGTIAGYSSGVSLAAGGSVGNTGVIQGGGLFGAGVDIGGAAGTVTNSGTIAGTGYGAGVYLGAGGLVANTGVIQGGGLFGAGVDISGGAGAVTNSGTIAGARNGIFLFADGSVGNSGLIEGAYGVNSFGFAGTLTNSGTIVGTGASDGAVSLGPGSVSNTGLIKGQGAGGVYIAYFGGGAGAVTNSGTILGTGGTGFPGQQRHNGGVFVGDGGSVANTAKGALIQGYNGVYIGGAAGSVTNAGTVAGTGAYGAGVFLGAGGSIGNTGLIQGYGGGHPHYKEGVIYIGGAAGTVTNSGTIAGPSNFSYGVLIGTRALGPGGGVDNTGLIAAGRGIAIYGIGTVINSGTIAATTGFGFAVVQSGGSVNNSGLIQGYAGVLVGSGTVTNSGTIVTTGQYRGAAYFIGTGNVDNTGLIQGYFGVSSNFFLNVTNSGTIAGTGHGSSGDGIPLVFAAGSIANHGLIQGYSGIFAYGGIGAINITNSGTIAGTSHGSGGDGISLIFSAGSIANNGLIQGVNGVYVGGAAGMVTNSGAIAGTGTGVILNAGGTVVDAGTITGGGGTAISFGGTGGNLLALEHGYKLGGTVTVAGTGNTLELLGAAGKVTVNFDKPGAGFTSFSTVAFGAASGHDETLTISNTASLPGTIAGFTQFHDIIDLTQLGPKGATAILNGSDQLVVSNGSHSVSLQLDPSENYSGVVWRTNPDGKGGTNITVQQAGNSPYAPPASHTSFGFNDITGGLGKSGDTTGLPDGFLPGSGGKGDAFLFSPTGGGIAGLVNHTALHGPPFG